MSSEQFTAIVTALGVIGGFFLTLWKMRQDRTSTRAAADRAESAARLTEEYSVRVVDALEAIAAGSTFLGDANSLPQPKLVRWQMTYDVGDTYRLANVGDTTAFDVTIRSHESLKLVGEGRTDGSDLRPGEARTFMAAVNFGTSDRTITVEWRNADQDERASWRYPLPAKE